MRLLEASHRMESMARGAAPTTPGPWEAGVVADLETEGVHVTTLDRLAAHGTSKIYQLLSEVSGIFEGALAGKGASAGWDRATSSLDLRADVLLTRFPELYLLGLDPKVLTLVRHYLKLPVAYHGAVVRHSLVDGTGVGPRLWHKDAEDFHVFRILVYLNDVLPGGGPFEYIPRHFNVTYKAFAGHERALTNEQMSKVVPPARWKRIFGPAGTVVLADTAQIFHHESLQTERERSVIMIGYSSRRPKALPLAMSHFPVERVRPLLSAVVPPANYDCVFSWRRLVGA